MEKIINIATDKPYGELVIKTLAMPSDTNANGDIFGGWVLSQMDLGGAMHAKSYSPTGRVVTVSIETMTFHNPIHVGDAVCCYAQVINTGRTSMKMQLQTWVYDYVTRLTKLVTSGVFTYVAIGDNGRPVALNKSV